MAPQLSITDRVAEADRARIRDGLAASDPALGPYAPVPLAVLLHEPEAGGAGDDPMLVGGLLGETVWEWLSVRLLWVDPAHRGDGHGRRLLAAAEAEACRRGCRQARLSTFSFQATGSFQAAGFYERCGWRQVLALDDFPRGHQRLFYLKPLSEPA